MRGSWLFLVAALGLSSCASTGAAVPEQKQEPALDPSWRPGSMPIKVGDDAEGAMDLQGAKGTLEQREVDAVLRAHSKELIACAEQAGRARRYAGGEVALRFFVTSTGDVSNVLVVKSEVGNFAVERCLVAEGRDIHFPAPRGKKATDFQYALQFQGTGEATVIDRSEGSVAGEVARLSAGLASCGEIGPAPVRAVVYIEPGGAVGSVGLASDSPLDVGAATCAVEQIHRWRLRDDRKHVVRASFALGVHSRATPVRLVKRVPPRAP